MDGEYKDSDTKLALVRNEYMTVLQCSSQREKAIWIAEFEKIKSEYSKNIKRSPERQVLNSFAENSPRVFAKCKEASPAVMAIAQSYSESKKFHLTQAFVLIRIIGRKKLKNRKMLF